MQGWGAGGRGWRVNKYHRETDSMSDMGGGGEGGVGGGDHVSPITYNNYHIFILYILCFCCTCDSNNHTRVCYLVNIALNNHSPNNKFMEKKCS